MGEQEQRTIFAKNLKYYLERSGHSQKEVAEAIGVSPQTFNTWVRGIALPRMGKVELLVNYFGINKSDLIDEHQQSKNTDTQSDKIHWYQDPETAEIAQRIFDDPNLRTLFDSAKDAAPEDLATVQAMLEALLRKEGRKD